MICDMRCVACNLPVSGREDVAIRKTKPTKSVKCQKCGTQQILVDGYDLADYHYQRSQSKST